MILADKLIIDLSNLNLISNKISKYLYRLTKLTKNAQSIDTGNDIEYSAKQLLIFKSKLLQLVSKESKKYQSDIFGNIIKSLNKYRYVEMMFSENYREITSIRLVGKNRDKTYNRYVLFNIENIFDPTVINLLVNAEEIIASIKRGSVAKTKYIQFLKNYFAPFPLLHQLKQQDSNFLENISLKYDNGQPKTYEELMKQNIELNSLSFKTAIFDKRKNSTSSVDGLSFLKPEIDSILKKLETAEQDNDPQELINLSQTYFLDKFKLPDVTESIYEGLSLDLNPYNSLLKLSAIDIFKSIDSFPPDIKKKIYEVLRDPRNPFNINKIFIDLQEFINLKLNIDGVVNTGISVLLKESSLDIESMDLKDLAIKITEMRAPESTSQKENLLREINTIIESLNEWLVKIDNILDIVKNNLVISGFLGTVKVKTNLESLKQDFGLIKSKLDILRQADQNFANTSISIYDTIQNTEYADLCFNINQLINDSNENTKHSVKLSRAKKNIEITDFFNSLKIRFPQLYADIESRFNVTFPKCDFLIVLKGLGLLKFGWPKFEIPRFKLPNFDFDINDLFFDFSYIINSFILGGLSCVLSNTTKTLLELLGTLGKVEDFASENIFPLPQVSISNNTSKFQAAFSEEWLIYVEYVYKLIVETERQRTRPQVIRISGDIFKNDGIKRKIIARKNLVPLELCAPGDNIKNIKIDKKTLKKRKINSIQDALSLSDIDSLLEKIKYYNFSNTHDYFKTPDSEDDIVIDVLRFIAKSLKETKTLARPKLPLSSREIIDITSIMVEQIESVLEQDELNSLLNGTYSEVTAEIVRNIAKINFPTLTYRVDPIKYFRMLGKVIGNKNTPKLDLTAPLKNLGVKI